MFFRGWWPAQCDPGATPVLLLPGCDHVPHRERALGVLAAVAESVGAAERGEG